MLHDVNSLVWFFDRQSRALAARILGEQTYFGLTDAAPTRAVDDDGNVGAGRTAAAAVYSR